MRNNNADIKPFFDVNLNNNPCHSFQYSSLPKIYVQNVSLDFCRVSNILKYDIISGNSIFPFITTVHCEFDINYPEDIIVVEDIARKIYK